MKKFFYTALLCIAVPALSFIKINDPLPIGASLPNEDVKMQNTTGKDVSFNDAYQSNGLLVMFSCNTCPVVKKYQLRTMEICKYAIANKIGVILLNSNEATRNSGDSFEDSKEYAKEQGYYFNYVMDTNAAMADAFGATRTPEIFLFDANKKLVYHGAIDDNSGKPEEVTRKHAQIAIDEMVAGKDVSIKETRFVGCSIKRVK